MAQLCFGVNFFSPLRTAVFFSRLFAELLRELLARLDDEPRERALLLARARGVTPRYPPVLMFHVFLSCIERGVEVSVRASLDVKKCWTGLCKKRLKKWGKVLGRTSETVMSCRMFLILFVLGNRRCPSSFPNGAVCSDARQFGHLGFSYLRSAHSRKSWAQSR